jgi:hypothetical protein
MSSMRFVAGAWLVLMLATAAVARGDDAGRIQAYLKADGSGGMNANATPGQAVEEWSWQTCPADGSACQPFTNGRHIDTAGAPPNTVFLATETSTGQTARTPIWRGVPVAATAPTVRGDVRANSLVTPVAGTWTGGWEGDYDRTQLAACRRPNGTACTTLTDYEYGGDCPGNSAVIDVAFTGQYLRVADQTLGPNTLFLEVGHSSPYGSRVWSAGPTTSVAMAGKIAPAAGPRRSACGPPPIAAKPSLNLGAAGIARVRCEAACVVVLRARGVRRSVQRIRRLSKHGALSVAVPARTLRKLGHGRVRLTVFVQEVGALGRQVLRRTVTLTPAR